MAAVVLVGLLGASAAQANSFQGPPGNYFDNDHHHHHYFSGPVSAPEIDPSAAVSALTLLAGGLAVVRGRRDKR